MGIIREGEQEIVHTFLDDSQFQKAIMQSFGYYADIAFQHDDRADSRAEKRSPCLATTINKEPALTATCTHRIRKPSSVDVLCDVSASSPGLTDIGGVRYCAT